MGSAAQSGLRRDLVPMQERSGSTATNALLTSPLLLIDGAIETRLIYQFRLPLPSFASFLAPFDTKRHIQALARGLTAEAP